MGNHYLVRCECNTFPGLMQFHVQSKKIDLQKLNPNPCFLPSRTPLSEANMTCTPSGDHISWLLLDDSVCMLIRRTQFKGGGVQSICVGLYPTQSNNKTEKKCLWFALQKLHTLPIISSFVLNIDVHRVIHAFYENVKFLL